MAGVDREHRAAALLADFEAGLSPSELAAKHLTTVSNVGKILRSLGVQAPDEKKARASSLLAYNSVKDALFHTGETP